MCQNQWWNEEFRWSRKSVFCSLQNVVSLCLLSSWKISFFTTLAFSSQNTKLTFVALRMLSFFGMIASYLLVLIYFWLIVVGDGCFWWCNKSVVSMWLYCVCVLCLIFIYSCMVSMTLRVWRFPFTQKPETKEISRLESQIWNRPVWKHKITHYKSESLKRHYPPWEASLDHQVQDLLEQ